MGAGIRVTRIAPDWRRLEVQMGLRWYNRNYVGTQFGGSLFAMADPFLMLMAIRNLGPEIRGEDGALVARVRRQLYVRRKRDSNR